MINTNIIDPEDRQWRMLLVYDIYRFISIGLLLGIYFTSYIRGSNYQLFLIISFLYFSCALIFLYFWQSKNIRFETQVFIAGTFDVIAVAILLIIIGSPQTGYGILLNVTIASLSMLVPGRLAIFFASLASSILLCGNVLQFLENNQVDLGVFFYSGIYGAGFFATALTAWYLANWVHLSETLALRRSEELARMQRINEYIVARLHSGIIYVDEKKQIKLVNSAARRFFGVNINYVPHHLNNLSQTLTEKFENFLLKISHHEGVAQTIIEEPYLRVHFFSTVVANHPAVLIILEDMTYIAQQAQQLKLASLGRFSASIAHELRNPLGAISHAAQLFGDEGGLSKEDNRLKQLIINNCDRMNSVIKNVLQLTRRQQTVPQIIDLSSFIDKFKTDFCHNNPCDCDFFVKLSKNEPVYVMFDQSQLEQILIILCENVLQHGRDEQGNAIITITVKATLSKTILSVSDLGPGIPPEHRDNVFEPFFTTLVSGTGMGLFIAKDLCEINHARLDLTKSSKGSCFSITINPSEELII